MGAVVNLGHRGCAVGLGVGRAEGLCVVGDDVGGGR